MGLSEMNANIRKINSEIQSYCQRYNIPFEYLVQILEDQKVLPMIRGKATELLGVDAIKENINERQWLVDKMNFNPQQDEDITIRSRKSNKSISVETKNATRSSFKLGNKRTKISVPHFTVKCHKSRSNIKKALTSNDRYHQDDFDILICNLSNSLFLSGTLSEKLEITNDPTVINFLKHYYSVSDETQIIHKAYNDWRYCVVKNIAQDDGYLPRNPAVKLQNDENWKPLKEIEKDLERMI